MYITEQHGSKSSALSVSVCSLVKIFHGKLALLKFLPLMCLPDALHSVFCTSDAKSGQSEFHFMQIGTTKKKKIKPCSSK